MIDVGKSITDLAVGPDGALYVATVDTIFREATPPAGAIQVPGGAPSVDGGGSTRWISIGLAVLAIAGLGAARLARGRRP